MSVATQVTDLSDLRTDLITRVRDATGVTATNNIADRYLNMALHDIHINPGNNWPWAIRRGYLLTHAPYTTGTVDVAASARTTVTGTDTLWNTTVTGMGFANARVGGKMIFGGWPEVYEVSAVGSDTSITINPRYPGDALSGATYTYFEDEYALASDFHRPLDWRQFSDEVKIGLVGPQEFRRRWVKNTRLGRPKNATIIQLAFSSSTAPRYRVVLNPVPNDELEIPYQYITTNLAVSTAGAEQTQMTATTDEPIIPLGYRHVLVFHALYHWYRDRKDDARSQEAKAEYVELLQRMAGDMFQGMRDNPKFVTNSIFPANNRKRFSGHFWVGNNIRDANGNYGD
jgi:hypothetical protein